MHSEDKCGYKFVVSRAVNNSEIYNFVLLFESCVLMVE